MNCDQVREHLLETARQGLGALPGAEAEAHLRSCAGCAVELAALRKTMALLEEWKAPEPSSFFDARLHARLRQESQERQPGGMALPSWMRFRRPALAAALAALLALGVGLYRIGRPLGADYNAHRGSPAQAIGAGQRGSAVSDLQDLEANHDMYANFELLDEVHPRSGNKEVNP